MQVLAGDKAENNQPQHRRRFYQKPRVGNRVALVNAHNLIARRRRRRHLPPEKEVKRRHQQRQINRHQQRQLFEKIRKRQPDGAADKNVRRVADKRCRTADV